MIIESTTGAANGNVSDPAKDVLSKVVHDMPEVGHDDLKKKLYGNEDSENFWKVAAEDTEFWDKYVDTRPNYSAPFYEEIFNYHRNHSTSWALAHDVGSGAGQVTAELSKHFAHVVASDVNDAHLDTSKRRLAGLSADKVSFTHSGGEDLYQHHPAQTVDLIVVAETMVLMDERTGLESFAHLLKPGGTLAMWFYGRPTFSDPTLREVGQNLIDEIMVRNWTKVIRGSSTRRLAGFKKAADGMASWLDYIALHPATWSDVHRIKWNRSATLPFFGEEACGFPIDHVSNVRSEEFLEERKDSTWWQNEWTIDTLKKYFEVLFPGFREANGEGDPEIDNLFSQLTAKMGGERSLCRFTWPVVLVLATKS